MAGCLKRGHPEKKLKEEHAQAPHVHRCIMLPPLNCRAKSHQIADYVFRDLRRPGLNHKPVQALQKHNRILMPGNQEVISVTKTPPQVQDKDRDVEQTVEKN
jgi:hypothetical protein